MPRRRRRSEIARLEAELADARPYLELAREIHGEVARVAEDESGETTMLLDAIAAIPERERMQVARRVFEGLDPAEQWAIIERVFGDEEIRSALSEARATRLAKATRMAEVAKVARSARVERRLDTREVPPGAELTLGLFREADVRLAVDRGRLASSCARRLVLAAAEEAGMFQVVEDVFNPNGGYFVTAEYDEHRWRAEDRLRPHATVTPGSIVERGGEQLFEPVLILGGRADFSVAGRLVPGRLHVGYAVLAGLEVFVAEEVVPNLPPQAFAEE